MRPPEEQSDVEGLISNIVLVFAERGACSNFGYFIAMSAGDHYRTFNRIRLRETRIPIDAVYEVSVKVDQTLYVVVTTSPLGDPVIQYTSGREVLVSVGNDTITWNDILGQSHDLPIISRSPFAAGLKSQD